VVFTLAPNKEINPLRLSVTADFDHRVWCEDVEALPSSARPAQAASSTSTSTPENQPLNTTTSEHDLLTTLSIFSGSFSFDSTFFRSFAGRQLHARQLEECSAMSLLHAHTTTRSQRILYHEWVGELLFDEKATSQTSFVSFLQRNGRTFGC